MTRVVLLALLLAGCPPADDVVPAPKPHAEPPSALPLLAGSDSNPEQAVVCLLLPESGPAAQRAADVQAGMELARAAMGTGPTRRRITFRRQDPGVVEAEVSKAFATCFNEGASLMIGPVHPGQVSALVPILALHEAALLLPAPDAAAIAPWPPNLAAVRPTSAEMGAAAARDALTKGARAALVIAVADPFGDALSRSFSSVFEAGGGRVRTERAEPAAPEAWAALASSPGLDAVFVAGPPKAAQAVAKLLPDNPYLELWVIDWGMSPDTLVAAGEARTRVRGIHPALVDPGFDREFRGRFGRPASLDAAAGHDALRLAIATLETTPTLWWEDVAATLRAQTALPSAFGGPGAVVERGEVYLDAAGHRPFVATKDEAGGWFFAAE